MTSKYAALIIFDVDGTLFRTELVTVPAVQRTFANHGLPIPDHETIQAFFGKPVEDYEAWLAQQCPPDEAAQIVEETNAHELTLIASEGQLYPGVHEMLTCLLEMRCCLTVCSNGPSPYVNEFVRTHGLQSHLTLVRARDAGGKNKTAMVADIMNEIPVRPAAVVGDRREDIAAARANGALAIAARYGFAPEEEHAGADASIDRISDLPDIIQAAWPQVFR
ncbi:MAG TPA: HAD family hydrolase [Candidatus Hydrogenedentes bacterium]|nr:HAD family hydrolase [Candidatus Hydrogenedentota bacterium]